MANPVKPPVARPTQPQKSKVAAAIKETVREAVEKAVFEKRPYLRMAFKNPYNLSLLIGGIAASVLTVNPIPLLIAMGGEALWLLHAPESKTLRRILWDPRFEKVRLAIEEQEREQRIRTLPQAEQDRVRTLVAKDLEINRLAAQNPSFTGDLLRGELVKTRKLVNSFIELALNVDRYERYLSGVDLDDLEKERERWHARSAAPRVSEPERDIAKKNFAVIMKRIEKLREIRSYLGVASAQLDLIDNSFQLIADQIVTMQSPAELSGQLDDLLDGVESIKQTQVDTERILNAIEA